MTFGIAAVLAILAPSLAFFVTKKLRMDVMALAVLCVLWVSGMVTPVATAQSSGAPTS